ncbi:hypothetical protein LCGC14_0400900 [marine sediment metagenome]|uniref:Uncharacterized protein n=1 Tax=marine sediment metagenome TaxID=412755 RepID=A0A0F9TEX7_9ZZZZ
MTLEQELYRIERELQIIRLKLRATWKPLPRWFRWISAKIWPVIFSDL